MHIADCQERDTLHTPSPIWPISLTQSIHYIPSLCQSFHLLHCHSEDEHVVLAHLFQHLNIGTIQRADRQSSVHLNIKHKMAHNYTDTVITLHAPFYGSRLTSMIDRIRLDLRHQLQSGSGFSNWTVRKYTRGRPQTMNHTAVVPTDQARRHYWSSTTRDGLSQCRDVISQSSSIHLLRHDKMQANKLKNKHHKKNRK